MYLHPDRDVIGPSSIFGLHGIKYFNRAEPGGVLIRHRSGDLCSRMSRVTTIANIVLNILTFLNVDQLFQ